jgi:RES domain-containing protein
MIAFRSPDVAFRIADRRHPIFDPTGAFLYGGRWNSPGKRVIYAAQTYAGALLEVLVHANLGVVPKTHAAVEIHIPDYVSREALSPQALEGWAAENNVASRRFGDLWLEERRTAVLLVPSVVLQGREANILLNPDHPDFARITTTAPEPVLWDPRLFSRPRN